VANGAEEKELKGRRSKNERAIHRSESETKYRWGSALSRVVLKGKRILGNKVGTGLTATRLGFII
jgi:hypothetical protein